MEARTLSWYQQLLRRYLEDRADVPAGRIFEAAYDDLRHRPLEVMEAVYRAFDLGGIDAARPRMEQLVREGPWELAGSRPLTDRQRAAVADQWAFAFREWGYAV